MNFHDRAKKNIFRFINDIADERPFSEVKEYLSAMKEYSDNKYYYENVVKPIQPSGPETDREKRSKYSGIRTALNIVAGVYYGSNLALEHIKRDYAEEIAARSLGDETLRREVMTFTCHLLFGREASGVEKVGELQIEQEGLVPMMNRIMVGIEGDEAQKHELMKHFRVYQLLSEQSLTEAAEAVKHDPHYILLRNTEANRGEARSSVLARIITGQDSKEDDSKESDTRGTSFAERYPSNKKTGEKKGVSFPDL